MEILSKVSVWADLPLWPGKINSMSAKPQMSQVCSCNSNYRTRPKILTRKVKENWVTWGPDVVMPFMALGTPSLKRRTGWRAQTTQCWREKAARLVLRLRAFHPIGQHKSVSCFLKVRSLDSKSVRGPAARSLASSSNCTQFEPAAAVRAVQRLITLYWTTRLTWLAREDHNASAVFPCSGSREIQSILPICLKAEWQLNFKESFNKTEHYLALECSGSIIHCILNCRTKLGTNAVHNMWSLWRRRTLAEWLQQIIFMMTLEHLKIHFYAS